MVTEDIRQEVQPHLATDIAQLWPPRGEWTEADYFALPDTNRFIELSEGELVMPPHPTDTHQRIVGVLYRRLHAFAETMDLGIVRFAPLPVRLWPGKIREPDILLVSHSHAERIGEQVYGPPDLVVEVISSGTRRLDRGQKFLDYASAGVDEYWLVDPQAQTIEVFVLEEGAYTLWSKFAPGERACSRILTGFEVPVDEVFAE